MQLPRYIAATRGTTSLLEFSPWGGEHDLDEIIAL